MIKDLHAMMGPEISYTTAGPDEEVNVSVTIFPSSGGVQNPVSENMCTWTATFSHPIRRLGPLLQIF